MATQAGMRRIALALPATREEEGHFAFAVLNRQAWTAQAPKKLREHVGKSVFCLMLG
jgi:hypothetical protein